MKTPFILILLAVVLTSFQTQEADLSLRLEEGKEYKQTSQSSSTVFQTFGGQEMKMDMVIKGSMAFLVKSADNDQYELEARYERLGMSMQSPQGSMEFSSDDDNSQNVFSQIMSAIIDQPFQVIMGKKGEVMDVQGVEELWENAINQFGELSEMQKQQIKSQLINTYGNQALKGNMEMITRIFPDNAVNTGDEWAVKTNLEGPMHASVDSKYQLAETSSDHVLINGHSVIESSDEERYVEMGGMQMRYDIKGTITSEIKIDKTTGWIIDAKISQTMEGDSHIKGNPQMPNGMTIPIETTTETVITH